MKDPIKPNVNPKEKKSPWDFTQPKYDERSSCYVNAGTNYGVGFKTPVGHSGNPVERVPTLPFGRPKTEQVDEIPRKNLKIEMR